MKKSLKNKMEWNAIKTPKTFDDLNTVLVQ